MDHHISAGAEAEAFIRALLDRTSRLRLPELFNREHPDAICSVRDRHGVSLVGLRTPSITPDELVGILTYRLAQYVLAGQMDVRMVFEARLEHEPSSAVSAEDIHFIAGSSETGELLSYVTLEAAKGDSFSTMAEERRPLFPVEEVFGQGLFRRLKILPDLSISRVRELGRFTKNQLRPPLDELTTRALFEVVLAIFSAMAGPLRAEIDAGIGDIEEGVAKKNLDFFHIPTVVIHGVVPYAPEGTYAFFNYQHRTRYPFAFLCSDISRARLRAIEEALELPGKQGIMAILALKGDVSAVRSRLEPPGGLAPLTEAAVPQQGVEMAIRRGMLDLGDQLRSTDLFRSLSVAEAAVLGTFLERRTAEPGETIIHQGDAGDGLYLIEAGRVEIQLVDREGRRTVVGTRGAGDCVGEIALVTGGERVADVVALTPMSLLRLSEDAYARYLAHMVEVEGQLVRTAATRTHETLRTLRKIDA